MDEHGEHDEHDGRRVSRRTALAGFAGLGALLAACRADGGAAPAGASPAQRATPAGTAAGATAAESTAAGDAAALFDGANTCALTPETTAGPYYFDVDRVRGDIREDRQGVPLRLAIRVQDGETCRPIPDAVVEIWHCDAEGAYSGVGPAAGGGGAGGSDTFLRGAQVTGADGIVRFTTVYPGFYQGRCVHIHAMVHLDDARVLTTQMMFPEEINEAVLAAEPYAGRSGYLRNADDSIYQDTMLLKVTGDGDGYLGVINFAVDSGRDRG